MPKVLCPQSALVAVTLIATSAIANATEIVYRPVNPAFGGDPLNGSVLLNSANAQNRTVDPSAVSSSSSTQKSALQQFSDSLQRSILSRISSTVSSSVFDSAGKLIPGTVETADFRIGIVDIGGGNLRIDTTDKVTGESASFQVAK